MLNSINEEIFISPEELAKKLKLSLTSIYKLVRSGELPSIRLGKIYRIPESDLLQYLKKQKLKPLELPTIPETVRKYLQLLKGSSLKKRIDEIYLYGSYARGDYDPDSDIDVLLILDRLDVKTKNLLTNLAEKAMAASEYQDLLSIREEEIKSWEKMKRENYPLAQNILREGIPIWKNH